MTANERIENARAAREAREAMIRKSTPGSSPAEDALRRYLASESFHEQRREEQERRDAALADDEDDR